MCPCTFIGTLFFSKSTYKNDLASDEVINTVKVLFFSTNISALRPFLVLSLTPVSFSADIKRSIPEVKASFLSQVTAGIYCRYILLIYVIYHLKYAPPSTLYFAFILSMPHIQQSLHNFLFKLTRRWSLLSQFPFLTFLGAVMNIHTTKFRIKNFYFQPTHRVYKFCINLRTNSDFSATVGFYSLDGECSLLGRK